jgi:hypothetical protein
VVGAKDRSSVGGLRDVAFPAKQNMPLSHGIERCCRRSMLGYVVWDFVGREDAWILVGLGLGFSILSEYD